MYEETKALLNEFGVKVEKSVWNIVAMVLVFLFR